MNPMRTHLADYLRLRRALGFELSWPGHILPQFVDWLTAAGAETITARAAIEWAQLRPEAGSVTRSHRLGAVRGFARYLAAIDPATEIPPAGVFGKAQRRLPYIYSPEQIRLLVQAAGRLRPPLWAAVCQALFGLLGVSGMRIGEALRLSRGDVNLTDGAIRVRHAKFDRERLVPLHRSSIDALRGYVACRDRLCPAPNAGTFFVSHTGKALRYRPVHEAFTALLPAVGLSIPDGTHARIHDLRHSMVVNTMIDWHRAGVDVSSRLPILSTYLGHVSPASTYWYISAVPELMQLAAARLQRRNGEKS